MEYIDHIDWEIFQWINGSSANILFDELLPWLRNKYFWFPLYAFLLSFLIFNYRKRGLLISFYLLLVFSTCDSISSRIMKPIFERNRPCSEPERQEFVVQRVTCPGGFSFPSSHAVNHAGISVFLFLFFIKLIKRWSYLFFLWALSIGYAQVYVGVHYPFDVLTGFLTGGIIGIGIFALFWKTDRILFKESLF